MDEKILEGAIVATERNLDLLHEIKRQLKAEAGDDVPKRGTLQDYLIWSKKWPTRDVFLAREDHGQKGLFYKIRGGFLDLSYHGQVGGRELLAVDDMTATFKKRD